MQITAHPLRPMAGRDPEQGHRVSTPLELLYDLTIVVAFGAAGSESAHALAAGEFWPGVVGFAVTIWAVVWCWINYTWFASAYDTDDWFVRLAVLVQMVGVVILALGIPDMFAGLAHGWELDARVTVAGYVVMRVAMVALWLRAARGHPERRATALTYAVGVSLAQAAWVALVIWLHPPFPVWPFVFVAIFLLELSTPWLAERKGGTPWHPHHIAERYGLLAIIALGECVIGTTAAVQALVAEHGWAPEAAAIALVGVGLTMGMWWLYFAMPTGDLLAADRRRSFVWGYGQLPGYAAIAAVGAGLHLAAYFVDGDSVLGAVGTIVATAVPLAAFVLLTIGLFHYIDGQVKPAALLAVGIGMLGLVAAVGSAAAGAPLWVSLALLLTAPWSPVIGLEIAGRR
ncbi:MAG: low temperature requirement protein A [Actinobacteria bacterium]|nr:low temperature requirement protein A [Actinomycetota bacterium]